jgi:L-lactate dehydrogenase complex protein LldE
MKVDLFITCLNDALFPRTGEATVKVLERLGHEVRFNPAQTCCGQMHLNTGYQKEAIQIIRHFVQVFKDSEAVVAPSGSCVAMVRDLYPRAAEWAGDPELEREAKALGEKVFELSEFLVKRLGVEDVGAYYPHRITYHPTCHAARILRVGDAPLRLLRKVRGLTLVELPDADQCCGFGGTFSVKNAETSTAMLADKVQNILSTKSEACSAGDNSCLMHIGGGLSRLETGTRVIHLAEILASTEDEVLV